ncbi:MAG: restriction endonuclease subunit S [Phycisphaerales bacterium]|nr:restriction endonuclease subunit S [Phycisphaerales bacterium]
MQKEKNIPRLRFPEFRTKWQQKSFGKLATKVSVPVYVEPNELYKQIGIRSHGKGIFHKEFVEGKTLGNKRVFWVKENALIINIVFAWEQAVAKTSSSELGMIASHRFPMYLPIEGVSDLDYLLHFFLTKKGKALLELASPGGAGRNKTLGQKEFENSKLNIPEYSEQIKIAAFLTVVNKKVSQLLEKKNLLEQYKRGVMQKVFSQEFRFKNKNGKPFSNWQSIPLSDLLDYGQPTKYIVETKEYNDNYSTPVLTAGKTFVLGYTNEINGIYDEQLPVIIFDDFTTSMKFVDFPFKVKSSAIKILIPKEGINIYFVYEAMRNIKYEISGHERHWISKYSKIEVPIPSPEEQSRISGFFSELNEKIKQTEIQIEQTLQFKNNLTQKMFC